MAAEMERDLIRERTLDGLAAAQGRPGPQRRPATGRRPRHPRQSRSPGEPAANQSARWPHTCRLAGPPSIERWNPTRRKRPNPW
jgi:hypothetical protein